MHGNATPPIPTVSPTDTKTPAFFKNLSPHERRRLGADSKLAPLVDAKQTERMLKEIGDYQSRQIDRALTAEGLLAVMPTSTPSSQAVLAHASTSTSSTGHQYSTPTGTKQNHQRAWEKQPQQADSGCGTSVLAYCGNAISACWNKLRCC